jgi:hypothetical protein
MSHRALLDFHTEPEPEPEPEPVTNVQAYTQAEVDAVSERTRLREYRRQTARAYLAQQTQQKPAESETWRCERCAFH